MLCIDLRGQLVAIALMHENLSVTAHFAYIMMLQLPTVQLYLFAFASVFIIVSHEL